jgi:hypothetical protein
MLTVPTPSCSYIANFAEMSRPYGERNQAVSAFVLSEPTIKKKSMNCVENPSVERSGDRN